VTILETIQRGAQFLQNKGIESPRLQSELLMAHALGMPRLRLYLDFERQLTEEEVGRVRVLITRRAHREPLQHIVGTVSFCGLELTVSPVVLIPRPETELLAELAWQYLDQRSRTGAGATPLTSLDFGTGSGCLALAIASHCPTVEICALDISKAALEMAQANVTRQGLKNVRFFLGDGFAALPKETADEAAGNQFDLIVSNPPYIPAAEIERLEPEVRDFDPRGALDGGVDGLDFMRRLASEAGAYLRSPGRLMVEFGDGQETAVRGIFQQAGWRLEAVVKDLNGTPRFVVCEWSETAGAASQVAG
jgi:release factor glutamine methyltransferase